MQACVLTYLSLGLNETGAAREQLWAAGLACWLCFECLLRPGEMFKLQVRDVVLPDFDGPEPALVIIVREPKTRRIWRSQFVLCKDFGLMLWFQWWVMDRSSSSRLFPLSKETFSSILQRVCAILGVTSCRFTPSSFRSGGATEHFKVHENLAMLQYHGRWTVPRTLEHYLHVAFSASIMAELTAEAKACLEVVLRHVSRLSAPPRRALCELLV